MLTKVRVQVELSVKRKKVNVKGKDIEKVQKVCNGAQLGFFKSVNYFQVIL